MRLDMHFHSKESDGAATNEEIIKQALALNLGFIAGTDHDIINFQLFDLAIKSGINSCQGVEISARDKKFGRHWHYTVYGKELPKALVEMLTSIRNGRKNKIKIQLDHLKKNGFEIDIDNFFAHYRSAGVNLDNLNIFHIAQFVYSNNKNIDKVEELVGEKLPINEFMMQCLKRGGKHRDIGSVELPEYEPVIDEVVEILDPSKHFISLAHPIFSVKNINWLPKVAERYKELGFTGIEINTKSTKDWVEATSGVAKDLGLILTFGSDCHFKDSIDDKHGNLGEMNPFISEETIRDNFERFGKQIL